MKTAIRLLALLIAFDAAAAEKYAIVIGIDSLLYPQTGVAQLKFAVADAKAMQEILETRHGYKVTPLFDSQAKRENVIAELSRLAFIAKPEDTILIYYAGHGLRNKTINQKTYWLTYDASVERLDVAGVRLPHLLDYVMEIPASRKLLLLDHCFSGDLILEPATGPARAGTGTARLEKRGGYSVDDIQAGPNQTLLILAGSERDAYEINGHGIFTKAVLDAFESPVADTNRDAKLSVDELRTYVVNEVPSLSQRVIGTRQNVVEKAVGSLSGWILAENLPVATTTPAITQIIDNYKLQLTRLHLKGFIGLDAKNWYYDQLGVWRDSTAGGQALTDGQQRLITSMREIFDSTQIPDARRGEQMVDLYKVATAPQ